MKFRILAQRVALAALVLTLPNTAAHAAVGKWIGGTSSDLLTPANWSGGVVPGGGVDEGDFVNNGSLNPNPTVSGTWNVRYIQFGDSSLGIHTAGEGGPARNFSGTG